MRSWLCAVVALISGGVQSQPTFEKLYDTNGILDLIELPSHNLLGCMATIRGVSLLAPDGNVIHTQEYGIDSLGAPRAIKQFAPNGFYFVTGYNKDSCSNGPVGKIYPLIGRMDSLGNVSAMKYYDLNADCYYYGNDLELTSNGSVITWGSRFALMVDPAGLPVWAKHFTGLESFDFIRELPGGDLLAGMNMAIAGAVVARMDPAGNFIWCKSYVRPKGAVHDCLIESDSSFIITGTTDSLAQFDPLPPDYHPKLFMMKLDGSGAVQWCKGYDSDPDLWYGGGGSSIERALDGNYVVLADLGDPNYNQRYRPFLMKTDQNGDTLWTSSAGAIGYRYDIRDLLAYSDGGYLYYGSVAGDLPFPYTGLPYIFKTDASGHLPCSDLWHPITVSDLFPVDSSFTPATVDGATMYPAFATDSVLPPITVFDGCDVINSVNPMRPNKFRVRPNPTTGLLTVEFDDPLMADSYYSVYDAMGRLLYQRPLPTGATMEEVDLSRYGKGTYAIKLTDRDGVRFERVVLE